ncbi:MAG TPA: hypothetical protein VFK76_00180 [Gaiellaceae bacterium]|nr:hypothetical protein [Gaiellaceae bacterium]
MRRNLKSACKLMALPTLALVVAAAWVPGKLDLVARAYALVLAAVVLAVALAALRRAYPPATPLESAASRRPGARSASPPTLLRLEQACALGVARSFDLHYRVRPRLRELAAPLLALRRGISLDRDSDAARRVLGETTWDLVRPDRPAPDDRLAAGIPATALRDVVASLERL